MDVKEFIKMKGFRACQVVESEYLEDDYVQYNLIELLEEYNNLIHEKINEKTIVCPECKSDLDLIEFEIIK